MRSCEESICKMRMLDESRENLHWDRSIVSVVAEARGGLVRDKLVLEGTWF
jgi:hypothetical protein